MLVYCIGKQGTATVKEPQFPPTPVLTPRSGRSRPRQHSAVGDVGDRSVPLQVDIQPIWLVILRNHHSWLNDTGLLREVGLAEGLEKP